jgi:hypothetical protein
MTGTTPDVTPRFTPEAEARFNEYLAHARAALAGCAELSPDDVEQDVRAHVAAEFPPGSGWVRLDQLETVLARLGRPEQWVSTGGPSPWRRGVDWVRGRPGAVRRQVRDAAARFRAGPDDWRLAYLTFGLFLFGVVVFPLFVVLLPASYVLARAAVALARERSNPLGPQRWLVYPPLVIVSLPLLLGLLLWPAGPAGAVADDLWRAYRADVQEALDLPRDLCEFLVFSYFISGALSLWGLIVGVTFWSFPRLPAFLFAPFFAGDRRAGERLTLVGGLAFALWLAFTLRTFPVGEWAGQWKQWVRDENRAAAATPEPRGRPAVAPRVELDRELQERRAKQVVSDFLRACRNQDAHRATQIADVPFYTGASGGNLLNPDAEPVIRDRSRLGSFFEGQLRQVRRTDQMPSEAIRVESYEGYKTLEANAAAAAVLDDLLIPTDFVVVVGRQGRETGRVFVKVRDNLVRIIGMTK